MAWASVPRAVGARALEEKACAEARQKALEEKVRAGARRKAKKRAAGQSPEGGGVKWGAGVGRYRERDGPP